MNKRSGHQPDEAMESAAQVLETEAVLNVDQLFREHGPYIARLLWRLTGPGDHVDDLLQETFIIAFRKRGEFAGRSSPRTWLHSVAVRVSMNHWRGLKRFYRFLGRLAQEPQSTPRAPDSEMLKKEKQTLVFNVLDRLPRKQREVFVLYELEELEGAEIAEILEIPEGTVWTRLHHARKRFKRLIEGRLAGEGR